MKAAIIIDLNGFITGVTPPVDDEVTGVFPIYDAPQPDEEGQTAEPSIIGYQVAVKPPEGLYKLKFDIAVWEAGEYDELADLWGEGLTQEELDAIHNRPIPENDQQKIARLEAKNTKLEQQLSQFNANFAGFIDQYYIDFPEKA